MNLQAGQKCILNKYQGQGKPSRPTPVEVVSLHCGQIYIVRETLTGVEYPADVIHLRPCKPAPPLQLTERQRRILSIK